MNMSGWQFSEHMSSSFERVLRFTIFNRSKAWSLYFRIADITFFFFYFFLFYGILLLLWLKDMQKETSEVPLHTYVPF